MRSGGKVTKAVRKEILDLYFNGDDRRIWVIASVVGLSIQPVSKVIDDWFAKKKKYPECDYVIFHSRINKIK